MRHMADGSILIEFTHDVWVLTLRGEHDISTQPSLGEELGRVFAAGSGVAVDLSQTEFIDSTVLHALVSAAASAERDPEHRIAVAAPAGHPATRVLELAGV